MLLSRPTGTAVMNKDREVAMDSGGPPTPSRIKALALVVLITLALFAIHYTSLGDLFTAEHLQSVLDRAGFWAPLAFIFFYAAGVCLFIPATVLTGIGAALFGPYFGFVYVWIGAMTGAVAAFWIGRTLGGDFAATLIGGKLAKYNTKIEQNGFAAVLYLRLIYFPFTVMNFGMGLTRVRFRDYFWGTAFGILAGTFIFTFFIGTIRDAWASGDWERLFSARFFLSLGLFLLSLYLPKAVGKISRDP